MPVVTYVDPDTVHNPSSGGIAPATWFTTHEANFRSMLGKVACKIRSSADQTLTVGGTNTITLGTVEFNNGMTTSTANTIIVPTSYGGKYVLSANLRVDGTNPSSNSTFAVDIKVNGTSVHRDMVAVTPTTSLTLGACPSFVYTLSVADAVTMTTTNVGFALGALSTTTANAWAWLSAVWLSA